MEGIRISNLRSIEDSDFVPLLPLNILLGANSSGKSSLLRTFPLFQQSLETRTTGPILWFGHLVDFGSFADAKNYCAKGDEISFSFRAKSPLPNTGTQEIFPSRSQAIMLGQIEMDVTLVLKASPSKVTYPSEYRLAFLNDKLNFHFNSDGKVTGAVVNGVSFEDRLKTHALVEVGQIFQQFASPDDVSRGMLAYGSRRQMAAMVVPSLESVLLRHASSYFDGRTQQDRRFATLRFLTVGSPDLMLKQLMEVPYRDEMWNRNMRRMSVSSSEFADLRNHIILARVPRILNFLDQVISKTFSQSKYIAPIRASAERFYRSQNLAIHEVDAKGSNLAMFLYGLKPALQAELEQWTMEELGIAVRALTDGAHVSIQLRTRGTERWLNLADLGFGFSQILPLIVQIWHSTRAPVNSVDRQMQTELNTRIPKVISIEQPELHLHPKFQALVIDMLARVIAMGKKRGIRFVFIIETHSETIVSRIGQLMLSKALDADDSQILIFEQDEGRSVTTIKRSHFTKDATLENWPFGFFMPSPPVSNADQS